MPSVSFKLACTEESDRTPMWWCQTLRWMTGLPMSVFDMVFTSHLSFYPSCLTSVSRVNHELFQAKLIHGYGWGWLWVQSLGLTHGPAQFNWTWWCLRAISRFLGPHMSVEGIWTEHLNRRRVLSIAGQPLAINDIDASKLCITWLLPSSFGWYIKACQHCWKAPKALVNANHELQVLIRKEHHLPRVCWTFFKASPHQHMSPIFMHDE